jgi:hypothetical protein
MGEKGRPMTPTIMGRWQTRLAMLGTFGSIISLIFALTYQPEESGFNEGFFVVLGFVAGVGLVWDIVFILLQRLRWDRDWPAVFQVAAGVIEGALIWGLLQTTGLPRIPEGSLPFGVFLGQYGSIWLVTFVFVQGPMRAFFPRWRFSGGRIV